MAKYLDETGVAILWERIKQLVYECCCSNGGGGSGNSQAIGYNELLGATPTCTCPELDYGCDFFAAYEVTAEYNMRTNGISLQVSDNFSSLEDKSAIVAIWESPTDGTDCPQWSCELLLMYDNEEDWLGLYGEVSLGGEITIGFDDELLLVTIPWDFTGGGKRLVDGADYVIKVYSCDATPA